MSASELAASPSVLISENYWQRRFAGDPAVLGKSIRLNGALFTIIGITPLNFTGTSIAVPNFWLPLSLYPLIHPHTTQLRDREDLCCRVFGRLAPGMSMNEAQAETTLLASRLGALHEPNSELQKPASAVISPGSPLPGIDGRLRMTIVLIMAAAGLVLVIACANAAGLQLARGAARQQELGMRLALGASGSRLVRQLMIESALVGALAGSLALPVTWAMLRVAVTKLAEQLPVEVTLILDVSPDISVFGLRGLRGRQRHGAPPPELWRGGSGQSVATSRHSRIAASITKIHLSPPHEGSGFAICSPRICGPTSTCAERPETAESTAKR
jgi:putative ABC transport system permease protein